MPLLSLRDGGGGDRAGVDQGADTCHELVHSSDPLLIVVLLRVSIQSEDRETVACESTRRYPNPRRSSSQIKGLFLWIQKKTGVSVSELSVSRTCLQDFGFSAALDGAKAISSRPLSRLHCQGNMYMLSSGTMIRSIHKGRKVLRPYSAASKTGAFQNIL
ncbi:hypothetical protein AKJ16_DCAP21235 [Drosera capensis]